MAPADGPASILIVVPTLDSHPLLPRLVDSLQTQTHPRWQVLFIDGPSGQEHRAYLQQLCHSDQRFAWQVQEAGRPGIFAAMNQGFAAAAPTDWLLFWGSDDWAASPTALERAAAAVTGCDLLVAAGRYASIGAGGEAVPGRRTVFRWRHSFRRSLFLGSTPPHQATLIGPGARQHLAAYTPGFRLAADLDYFLELSRFQGLRVRMLAVELVQIAVGGVSGIQHQRRLQEVRQAYRRAFGLLWWCPFLLRYLQRAASAIAPRLGRRP
ncbi:glycosyltransferase [Synechococcus sp. CS-1324]|nr:glycosyltransferase [Synechococcus sp. CS-1324]